MKNTIKFLAMLLALCMVLSLSAVAFASGEPSGEASAEAGVSVEEAYLEYIHEWLLAELEVNTGGMTIEIIETEVMPAVEAGRYDEFPADMLYNGMLDSGVAMTFEEFAAQYTPGTSVTDDPAWGAYVDYIYDFLVNQELPVNTGGMTIEIIENELMPLVEVGNFEDGPSVLLFNGLLDSGVAMTFEEFKAQNAPAGGDTSVEAWHAYLKEYVDAVPAVDDVAYEVFCGLIDADDFTTPPADMMFNAQWWGFAAMTYDEFVAAGGVYEIPAFDPNLVPD